MDIQIIFDYIKKAFEATKAWFLMAWETVKTPEFWDSSTSTCAFKEK